MLTRASARYLTRHPWLLLLSLVGVALGVAVVVAVDLANESATSAFGVSTETVAGQATHSLEGAAGTIPDSLTRRPASRRHSAQRAGRQRLRAHAGGGCST